ncbi:MAG: cellulase family glycosylhydrolase [Roseburia sp.]
MIPYRKWGKKAATVILCAAMAFGAVACQNGDTSQQNATENTESAVAETTEPETDGAGTEVSETEQTEVPETEEAENGLEKIGLETTAAADEGNPLPFTVLDVDSMVAEMGTGWNLGNTMDGHSGFTPNETLWQDDETTQELIDAVHDLGFNAVRIPVTWGTMINDEDYSINDKWMSRVQDIVDYCINQDMYVIINIHHDGADQSGWLRVGTDDLDSLYEKFAGVWTTIATRFRDYDEHLIFESMNEVTGDGTTSVQYDTAVIMNLNQIFVNVVRSTGSNNVQRWLSVPGRYTNVEHMTNEKYGFDLPEDVVKNRIFAAVHYYDYSFGMEESMTKTEFDEAKVDSIAEAYEKLVTRFTSQGIPVIMGEYGAVNKNNPEQRAYHNEVFNLLAKQSGVVPVYWDQGWYDRSAEPTDYSFTLVDRKTYQCIDKEVTDGLMRGFFADTGIDVKSLAVSPEITPISEIAMADVGVSYQLELEVGQRYHVETTVEPENTNDVLLWKTADYHVVTVYNGMIHAKGIGTTTITAFSQSGSAERTLTVTVNPVECADKTTAITTDSDAYELSAGSYVFLNAASDVAENRLTYISGDPKVATVSQIGKLTAIAPGSTEITITSQDGVQKTVAVTVTEVVTENILTLSLNVLYNDDSISYYGNETGPVIEVTGDGQYTVTFDCGADLSSAAAAAGVTGLNNLTAIYIKDYAVTAGEQKKSNLTSCDIRYDSIVVDGTELTINQSESKSALKSSGIFDTNDPFNSWDGSAVDEVQVKSHVLNLDGIENPQTVTVTFTLSNLEFAE